MRSPSCAGIRAQTTRTRKGSHIGDTQDRREGGRGGKGSGDTKGSGVILHHVKYASLAEHAPVGGFAFKGSIYHVGLGPSCHGGGSECLCLEADQGGRERAGRGGGAASCKERR